MPDMSDKSAFSDRRSCVKALERWFQLLFQPFCAALLGCRIASTMNRLMCCVERHINLSVSVALGQRLCRESCRQRFVLGKYRQLTQLLAQLRDDVRTDRQR